MTDADARKLIGQPPLAAGPQVWADLGAGDGTFTVALASILPPDSVVHAMDLDHAALKKVPHRQGGVSIVTHAGDINRLPWPFVAPDGVMMANSLHYISDQAGFLRQIGAPIVLLVEYDTDQANPWVPYPVSHHAALQMFKGAGYDEATALGRRRSRYRGADLYALALRRKVISPGARIETHPEA